MEPVHARLVSHNVLRSRCLLSFYLQCACVSSLYQHFDSRLRFRLRERALRICSLYCLELTQHGMCPPPSRQACLTLNYKLVHLRQYVYWRVIALSHNRHKYSCIFPGVVVESFSYVFQATDGSKAITRGQMRAFKEVWGKHANPKSGYLERDKLVPFLYVGVPVFWSCAQPNIIW